jgi:hypothetical protein
MIFAPRAARIAVLLFAVLAVSIAVITFGGTLAGDRIYFLNSTKCMVLWMEEHSSIAVEPGETVLFKTGFLGQTPGRLLIVNSDVWFQRVRVSTELLKARGQADIALPVAWRTRDRLGSIAKFELRRNGELALSTSDGKDLVQPVGLPLRGQIGTNSEACTHIQKPV